jgi:hypothetical protein
MQMKNLKLTLIAGVIAGLSASGAAQADFSANMSRVVGASGSGHTVIDQCGGGAENWDGATATIENVQAGGDSTVKFRLKGGKPNTHYTLWVRMKGKGHGATIGGSPITGGGATPLANTSGLDALVADWIGSGSNTGANSFDTNHQGDANVRFKLDFPLEGGAYPFNRMSAQSLLDIHTYKNPAAEAIPSPIVDPRDASISSAPFMIRMVSHCQDGLGHGLSPSNREAWFQYP